MKREATEKTGWKESEESPEEGRRGALQERVERQDTKPQREKRSNEM